MRNKGIVRLSPGRRRCRGGQPGDWTWTDYKAVLLGNPLTKGAGTTVQRVTLASRFGGERNEEFSAVPSLPQENSKTTFEFIPPNICPFFEKQLKFLPSWTHPLLSRLIRDRETISGSSHRFSLCVHSRQESVLGFLCTINDITIINNCNCGNDYSKQHSLSCYVLTIPLCPL